MSLEKAERVFYPMPLSSGSLQFCFFFGRFQVPNRSNRYFSLAMWQSNCVRKLTIFWINISIKHDNVSKRLYFHFMCYRKIILRWLGFLCRCWLAIFYNCKLVSCIQKCEKKKIRMENTKKKGKKKTRRLNIRFIKARLNFESKIYVCNGQFIGKCVRQRWTS